MQTNEQPELVYLTNACGERTGYGTIELTAEDLNKVAFDEGPGMLATYIGEIGGRAHALAVLLLAFKDPVWPEDEFDPKEDVERQAKSIGDAVQQELSEMFERQDFHVLVEEGSGCFEVIAAVALDKLQDCMHTRKTFSVAFGGVAESKDQEIERQLPQELFLVANGSNGAAPRGCEIVLDDVQGGNEERDYFLISVVNGDPDVLNRMARRVCACWQIASGIDTDQLQTMALRGKSLLNETQRLQACIDQLKVLAIQAITAASDLSNGFPERELAVSLDQLKATAAQLGLRMDS